jgi:hypothetical protein
MDNKMNKGLMPARTFAEQYQSYVMGNQSSDPYTLAMHMTLVQGALSGHRADTSAANKVYSKMSPDVKDSVKDALSDGQYSSEFVSELSRSYGSINAANGHADISDADVLNKGVITDLSQTVESARSDMNTMTPLQSLRELAVRNGANPEEVKALVASAVHDLGAYAMSAEEGAAPSDDATFRFTDKDGNYVDYAIDAMSDKITMTTADGVTHDFVGDSANEVIRAAIKDRSIQTAIGQSFNFDDIRERLATMREQGAASFGNDEPFVTKLQVSKDDGSSFTAVSTYGTNTGEDVTANDMIVKRVSFEDKDGNQVTDDDKKAALMSQYETLGFSKEGVLSMKDAMADVSLASSDSRQVGDYTVSKCKPDKQITVARELPDIEVSEPDAGDNLEI